MEDIAAAATVWAGVKCWFDEVTATAASPAIARFTGLFSSADIAEFTNTTTFLVLQSLRLDFGVGSYEHP